jgi:modification methylase
MGSLMESEHVSDLFPSETSNFREAPGAKERSIQEKMEAKKRAWARRPDLLKNTHAVYLGDARTLRGLPKDTRVHLVVTSPPYWNLKPYHSDREGAQLGHIAERKAFLRELGKVWRRCYRLLVPGGRLCVVVGDVCRSRKAHGRHVVEPLHAHIQVQCQDIGFDPLAPIIWNKIANMVTEVSGNGAGFLGKPYEPNAIIKNDIEYILVFRKPGGYRHPTQEQRDLSLIDKGDHARWFQQIWSDVPGGAQRQHPAPFPAEIPRRLIGMYSFVGDTVFDPFWGIGNTTLAAIGMHRSSIGFEIEPEYLRIGKERLSLLPEDSTIEFIETGAGKGAPAR